MQKIRILSESDIEKLFTLPMAIEAVEKAYLQKQAGSGEIWPMIFHEFEPGRADLDIKSGNLNQEEVFGLKVVSWYGANPEKKLPALFGTSLIFDIKTGAPKAVLNAGPITAYRTGAAGAIGAKYLARKDAKQLLVVGCGEIATFLIAATLITLPQIEKTVIINPWKPELAVEKLEELVTKVENLLNEAGVERHAAITAETAAEEAVRASDVILTATPSYEPLIKEEWVQPGTHFSCVGLDMTGKQEIDSSIFKNARIFGDDVSQCLCVGECEKPYKEGVFTHLDGEIGEVISGNIIGRNSEEEITIFDSTGIALQDLASAAVILKEAEKHGYGVMADI